MPVEENVIKGGAGAGVNEYLAASGLRVATLNLGLPDEFLGHGSQSSLLASCGLDNRGIQAAITRAQPQALAPQLGAAYT